MAGCGARAAAWRAHTTDRCVAGHRRRRPSEEEAVCEVPGWTRKFWWLEGRTVRIEYRFAAAAAGRYQPLAKELVALQPEVILAVSTPVTAALQRETTAIPIVFLGVSDPIGSGFAASLARPGGNLTGLMMYDTGIAGKWLAMLKEITPRLARAALVAGPKLPCPRMDVLNETSTK